MSKRKIRNLYARASGRYRTGISDGLAGITCYRRRHETPGDIAYRAGVEYGRNFEQHPTYPGRPDTLLPVDVWSHVLAEAMRP